MPLSRVIACDIFGVNFQSMEGPEDWSDALESAAKQGGYTILDTSIMEFDGGGLTATLVLAESHLSIHTWPEYDYISFTLESCKEEESSRAVVDSFLEAITYDDKRIQTLDRYARPNAPTS